MRKIIPHLWFDKEAKEAAEFYISAFGNGKITLNYMLHDTPGGDAEVVGFELLGRSFMAISAGPLFKFNPSTSFMVNFDPSKNPEAKADLDALWAKLSEGGKALMELDKYPFSERYGWIEDKYGLSWQLILTDPMGESRPNIIPALLFVRDAYGRGTEAIDFYVNVFKDSKKGTIAPYGPGREPEKAEALMFGEFAIEGDNWFALMESALQEHNFAFDEAVSFMVPCDTQEEIDYYWEKLSAVPEAEQCGWLKDKFGVSWQIVPSNFEERFASGTPEQQQRLTQAFLQMKKFDLATLDKVWEEKE
jgi:predicted 3-demethylubiquinone-9 3-methyltransferase (glyoxalase superfamily)